MKFLIKIKFICYLYMYTNGLKKFGTEKGRKRWLLNVYLPLNICRKYTKNSLIRNLMAKLIKQVRKEFPFKPIDYSEAKELYEKYFKLDNHITYDGVLNKLKLGKDVYLTFIRKEIGIQNPNKPEVYEKFNMYTEIGTVFKVEIDRCEVFEDKETDEKIEKYNISLKSPSDKVAINDLNEFNFAHYRYSNDVEIKEFKNNENKYNDLKIEIDSLREKLNNKVNKQSEFFNCVVK